MKKRMLSIVLVSLITLLLTVPVFAAEGSMEMSVGSGEETLMTIEQFMWYHRVYNGQNQRRLWNITRGRWETEWMNC